MYALCNSNFELRATDLYLVCGIIRKFAILDLPANLDPYWVELFADWPKPGYRASFLASCKNGKLSLFLI